MAKVFSQSKGGFIDVPDATTSTSGSSGGVNVNNPDINNILQKAALIDLAQGGKNISKISGVASLFPAKSADEKKNATSFNATDNLIKLMEQRFQEAGGAQYSDAGARVSGFKNELLGKLGLNSPAKVYDDQRKGFAATLKQLTGDTGVLTDQDYARLSALIPSLGATPEEAQSKFNDLRSQLAAKFGGQSSTTTVSGGGNSGGLLAALFPSINNEAKIIKNYPQLLEQTAKEAQQKGVLGAPSPELLALGTPGVKKENFGSNRFLNAAISSYKTVKGSQDVAAEIATPILTAVAIKQGLQKLAGVTVKGALENRASAAEKAAEQGIKFSGKDLYKKAQSIATNGASETDLSKVRKILETIKPELEKTKTPQEMIEKLTSYNKAYSAAGKVGKSAKAVVDDALSKATRDLFSTNAPEIAKSQQILAKAMKLKKFGGSVGRQVVGTGVGVGAAGLIGWLLGRKPQ